MQIKGAEGLKEFEEEWYGTDVDDHVTLGKICKEAIKTTCSRVARDLMDGNAIPDHYDRMTPWEGRVRRNGEPSL